MINSTFQILYYLWNQTQVFYLLTIYPAERMLYIQPSSLQSDTQDITLPRTTNQSQSLASTPARKYLSIQEEGQGIVRLFDVKYGLFYLLQIYEHRN